MEGGGNTNTNASTGSTGTSSSRAFRPNAGPVPPPLPPPPPPHQRYAAAGSGDASAAEPPSPVPFPGTQAAAGPAAARRSFVPLPQRGPFASSCSGPAERASAAATHGRGPPRPAEESLAELSNLSDDDLQDLLDDDEALRVYFEELDWVKDMQLVHEELQAGNETLARQNLPKNEELVRLKEAIAEQQRTYAALRAQFNRKLDEQNRFLKRYEPQHVLLRLKSTLSELDAQSERYADDFVGGKMDATEFIVKFRGARKAYHLRAAKAETLAKR